MAKKTIAVAPYREKNKYHPEKCQEFQINGPLFILESK